MNPYLPEFLTPKNSENMQPHSNNYWKCNPIAVNQVKIYNLIKRHIPISPLLASTLSPQRSDQQVISPYAIHTFLVQRRWEMRKSQ